MTRFALVLGGGGYAGTAFHAGVVTALARAGWDARHAEIVIGTSAGATTAALLGAGFPPREYVSLVLECPLSAQAQRVMSGIGQLKPAPRMPRPRLRPASPDLARRALRPSSGLPFGVFLAAAAPAGTVIVDDVSPGYGPQFDFWPDRPTWITAVDLHSGSRAVFGRTHRATLPEAVSASVAIPGYFAPVVIAGVPYVDGGAWSTHHADLLLDEDVEVVIISAPSSAPEPLAADPAQWLRAPIRRQLYREVAALRSAGKQVVVIEPDRRLRDVIGVNSLSLRRRKPVALATLAFAAGVLVESRLADPTGGPD
jgi:NTE family protein